MRIDKWLWAARFYKTRSLAAEELDKGRVQLNGHAVKPAHEIKPGDKLTLRQGTVLREIGLTTAQIEVLQARGIVAGSGQGQSAE